MPEQYEGFGETTNPDGTPWYPPSATPGTPEFQRSLDIASGKYTPPKEATPPQDDTSFFQSLMDAISGTTSKVGKASNGLGGKIANQREQVIDSYKSFVDKLIKIIK